MLFSAGVDSGHFFEDLRESWRVIRVFELRDDLRGDGLVALVAELRGVEGDLLFLVEGGDVGDRVAGGTGRFKVILVGDEGGGSLLLLEEGILGGDEAHTLFFEELSGVFHPVIVGAFEDSEGLHEGFAIRIYFSLLSGEGRGGSAHHVRSVQPAVLRLRIRLPCPLQTDQILLPLESAPFDLN